MKLPLAPGRVLGVLSASLALLVACQSTSSDPTPATQTVSVPLAVSAVSRIPDSMVWHSSKGDGSRKISCSDLTCPQEIELKSALGSGDTLFVDVWKWGVFVGTAKFLSPSGSPALKPAGSTASSLSVELLESFADLRASKDTLKNATSADLVAYYAKLLLDSSTTHPGDELPEGMDAAALKKAVVLLSNQRGLTHFQLQTKEILGLSADSIRAYVALLVKADLIKDTTVLFPSSPLWVRSTLAVGDLTQGEGAVEVVGEFGWKTPRNVTATIEVRTEKGREDSVTKKFENWLNPKDGVWSLAKNLTLQANVGARPGVDTLIATLSDDSGHTLVAHAIFQVRRGDTLAPVIKVVNPPSDTTVSNATFRFPIRIEATDNKAVAGVKIGSKTFSEAPYLDTVDLAVGGNVIPVEAWDAAGNRSTKNVVILRSKPATGIDTTKPVVTFTSPSGDIEVPFATKEFDLAWKATDDVGVTKATLDGDSVSGNSDGYGKKVSLAVGPNTFVVKAFDAVGNLVSQSVRITRLPDPGVLGIAPLPDRDVPSDQDTALLSWTLTHPDRATSISLDGQVLDLSGGKATKTVSLSSGPNTFVLVVKDSSGKSVSDTVVVTRAPDATGPAIVWVTPSKPATVEATVTSYPVRVKVDDPSGVDSVHIQGKKASIDSGDIWIATLPLPQPDGSPIVIHVQAWDKKKNSSTDSSMSVTRSVPDGTEKPAITLVKPSTATGNTLVFDSAVLHVQAKITGDLIPIDPATVFFNNVAANAQGDLYTADVPVPATGAAFTITLKAVNTAKNGATLDLTVTRAKDPVAPAITPSATTKSQTVPFETRTFDLSWTIADNDSLATLKFNGSLEPTSGTLKKTVNLAVGPDTFTVVAIDRAGNSSTSRIVITRSPDLIAPVVAILSPSHDTTVPYGTASIVVQTRATDAGSGIQSVKVNGVLADKSGLATVPLTANKVNLITAIAIDSAGNADTATVNATVMDIVATPTFTPPGGSFTSPQSVTISSATPGATIYYTTDGTTPTTASNLFGAPVTVATSETIKAIAIKAGLTNSAVGSAVFTITLTAAAPTFTPPGGTYPTAQTVSLSSTTDGSSIYYTTDGTAPTTASKLYSTPITAAGPFDTIRAITVKSGYKSSSVSATSYTITDVTLKSIRLNVTMSVPVTGTVLTSDSLEPFSSVFINPIANASGATVTVSPSTNIKMTKDTATAFIEVKNGSSTQTYTLRLIARHKGTIQDERDLQYYKVIKIGSQWWMAQNLNYGGSCNSGIASNCDIYGSMGGGICPTGWRQGNLDDWTLLAHTVGGVDVAGKHLKSKTWDGDDAFGFNLLPGGGHTGGAPMDNAPGSSVRMHLGDVNWMLFSTGDDGFSPGTVGDYRSSGYTRCILSE